MNKEPISIVECCDNVKFMKQFPDKYFDLVVADPEYGIKTASRGNYGSERGFNKSGTKTYQIQRYKRSNWDSKPASDEYFFELIRVTKNQIIFGANHFISKIPYDSPCWIVWDKDNSGDYADCELAWTSFKTSVKKFEFRWNGMLQGDMKNKQQRIHITQKPIQIYSFCYSNYAKKGDKILDPNLGSQSSRIAAYKLGFDFYGCELDEDYFKEGCARFDRECHGIIEAKNGVKIVQQSLF